MLKKLFFNSDNEPSTTLLEQIKSIKNTEGIYIFKDEEDTIIYVGKSKKLRNRVSSYFKKKDWSNNPKMHWRTKDLVRRIKTIEIIKTISELEALLLEDEYIKTCLPKYNVRQKKDHNTDTFKSFSINLNDDFPTLEIVNYKFVTKEFDSKIKDKNIVTFGPYPNTFYLENLLYIIHKFLKLKNCTTLNFRENCFDDELGICLGPCKNKNQISKDEYKEKVTDNVINFLSSKSNKFILDKIELEIENTRNTEREIEKLEFWKEFVEDFSLKRSFYNKIQEKNLIITEKVKDDKEIYCNISKKGIKYNFSNQNKIVSSSKKNEIDNINLIYDRINIIFNYLKKNKENCNYKFI